MPSVLRVTNRRDFLTRSTAAVAVLPLSGCAGASAHDYERAAQELRAPPPALPELRGIVRYATLAANAHNAQPWRFRLSAAGHRISILPDLSRRTPVVDPDGHHLFVSLGCAVENLSLAASAHGQRAAIEISVEGRIDAELTAGEPQAGELYYAIARRQSTRSLYDGRAIAPAMLKQLEEVARVEGVSVQIVTSAKDRDAVLQYVIAANNAQMADPAVRAELLQWIRFNESEALATRDGLFTACAGNPTIPTWMGRGLFQEGFRKTSENDKYARQVRSSSGIAIFFAERADRDHWVRVGRAFERFALQCTALGLCHAHVNQPIEVPTVRADFARWAGAGDTRPDLVVRFGTGPGLPMSMRRSVDAVLDT